MPRTKQFCEKEVLNKAVELFWEKGFHATSMQDLVSHLGINRASLYDTYGGKQALFDKAFEQYRKTSQDFIQQIFERESSVKKGFSKLFTKAIEETINDVCKKGCFVVNTTTELVPNNENVQQTLTDNYQGMVALFSDYIQKGIASGELPNSKNAQELALTLFALYNGIRVLAKVETDPNKLGSIVNSGLSVLD